MTPQNVAMINNLHKIVKFCVNVLGVDNEMTVDQLVGQDITYSGAKDENNLCRVYGQAGFVDVSTPEF